MRLNPSLSPHDKWVTDPIARSLPSAYLCHCKRGNSNSCVQTSTKVSGSIDFGTTTNRYRFWVRTPTWKGPAPREANFGPDVYVHSNWRTAVKFGVIKPSRRCEGYCVSTICLPKHSPRPGLACHVGGGVAVVGYMAPTSALLPTRFSIKAERMPVLSLKSVLQPSNRAPK